MNDQLTELTNGLSEGFDKIASAYGIPEELHEDAKAELVETLESMVKQAGFFTDMTAGGMQRARGMAGKGFMGNGAALLGAGAAAVGTTLAANAISGLASSAISKIGKSYGAHSNRQEFENAFKESMDNSEILQQDPIKSRKMAETIFRVAPTMSGDSNLLTNILNNAIHGDSMDLQTVKVLTELEEKHNKNRNF